MALLSLRGVKVSFGIAALLDGVDLQIEPGERICLVGRNGAGKSTLMKVINGDITPDEGEIIKGQGFKVARLTQEVPLDTQGTVYDVVASGLQLGGVIAEYHQILHDLATDDSLLPRLEIVQNQLESQGGWELQQRVDTVISRLELPEDVDFASLSGGLRRRVFLARTLVDEPDLLLLDEPTNHLDIDAIRWLEEFLLSYRGTLLFITHDRSLVDKLATRIIELDRGNLTSWPGNYSTYLERKEAALEAEAQQNALFDKKLAQEEVWIRQGIKARRTRNEGRVRALKALRDEHKQRRNRGGSATIKLHGAERSGKLVAEAENLTFSFGDKLIVNDFSTTLMRGDKVGIIGPNGVGKSTLLKLVLGQLEPQQGQGTVKLGTKVEIAYFDQYRAALDEEKSVIDNVAEGSAMISINGVDRHPISYLQDFLFSPQRAQTPVKALSGGERNRLLLARLFTKPANVLVMDEPTNDLDMETLELLEELLLDYKGTLLLVSHDRAFLNNVVTSTWVFDGKGQVDEFVGGYDDWLRQREIEAKSQLKPKNKVEAKTKTAPAKAVVENKSKKLSYNDQRELDALPKKIEASEALVASIQTQMADPEVYQKGAAVIAELQAQCEDAEAELSQAYERWETLEAMKNG